MSKGNGGSGSWRKCYETHPPLKLGADLVIYGGSCANPLVRDADVYVGLDQSIGWTRRVFPWVEGDEFLYRIMDQDPPRNHETFAELIEWLAQQVTLGRKVHVGCIGGHGRTGMVLAALVSYMNVSHTPIKYVRDTYCKKAVESQSQIDFLVEHWNCDVAEPTKKPKLWDGHGSTVVSFDKLSGNSDDNASLFGDNVGGSTTKGKGGSLTYWEEPKD